MDWLTIINTALSIILTSLCGWISITIKKRSALKSSTSDALKILLRKELRESYNAASKRGSVSLDDISEMEEVYRIYHDELGGNGTGTRLYEMFKQIPIEKEG